MLSARPPSDVAFSGISTFRVFSGSWFVSAVAIYES